MQGPRLSELELKFSVLLLYSMEGSKMGRSILLWLIGVPIPIIILIALFWH